MEKEVLTRSDDDLKFIVDQVVSRLTGNQCLSIVQGAEHNRELFLLVNGRLLDPAHEVAGERVRA